MLHRHRASEARGKLANGQNHEILSNHKPASGVPAWSVFASTCSNEASAPGELLSPTRHQEQRESCRMPMPAHQVERGFTEFCGVVIGSEANGATIGCRYPSLRPYRRVRGDAGVALRLIFDAVPPTCCVFAQAPVEQRRCSPDA